jgi:GH15 family glucan-1,4-alpha-glucosidase
MRGELSYLPNTNVLVTRFARDGAAWEVSDFAPWLPDGLGHVAPTELVRIIRPLAGQPTLRIDFDPRPDYSRAVPHIAQSDIAIEVRAGDLHLELYTNLPSPYVLERREFVLSEPVFLVLHTGPRSAAPTLESVHHDLARTVTGWRAWAKACALPSFAPGPVLRSALCIRLHASHSTGAIIAAATTSIPEAMGTERTWDYRYCWLRDAAFVVEALRRVGHLDEGERFIRFLRDVSASGPLQPVYSVDGGRELPETTLTHLAGFGNNGHVRVGNAAALQLQNDLMGEMVLCLDTLLSDPRIVHDDREGYFPLIKSLVEQAISLAPKDDMGIWEFRTIFRPYTFSRAMCWAAISRGALIARRLDHQEEAARWEALANAERVEILARGYNDSLGFFTQTLGGTDPDASILLLPTIGIIDAKDPRFVSTVAAFERLLVDRGLMLRYRNRDDFGETTSAFTVCSFWWAEALALVGRLDEAIHLFDRLVAHANAVGLFSEDIEPETGALLGNFPQAYTHVGLIHAAMTIGELLDARDGRVRAWT